MSFRRYPAYKGSGVEWIGEVPGHWQLAKLKHLARFAGGGTPSRDNPSFWGGSIPWVSPKDMKVARIETAEECITEEGLAGSSTGLIPPGRVLMVVRSGILKHTIPVAINAVEVALNQDMKALDFSDGTCSAEFFFRWVQGLNDFLLLEWAKQGATVESIEHAYLAETLLPLPPAPEQAAIAAFLDRETAKIDALVAEQQNLIALLKEKRQALISHAVTKGLDPDAPMKDSGVAWLGEVPAHWEVTRIKRLCELITDGAHISPETEGGVFPFVSTTNISDEGIDFVDCLLTSPSSYEYLVKTGCKPEKGDILFSKDGTIGRTTVVRESRSFVVASSLIIIRPNADELSSEYLNYLCGSDIVTRQVESLVKGAGLPRLSIQNLLKVVGIFPPINEQIEIAMVLEQQTSKFDELIEEAERGIEFLLQRRTALISAAVTGKIDVRHLAAASAEPAPEPV